jgi:hypothetical protein
MFVDFEPQASLSTTVRLRLQPSLELNFPSCVVFHCLELFDEPGKCCRATVSKIFGV